MEKIMLGISLARVAIIGLAWVVLSTAVWGCGDEVGGVVTSAEHANVSMGRQFDPPDISSERWVLLNSCLDQMSRARWSWDSYRALLEILKDKRYLVVPLRDFKAVKEAFPERVVVGMRHDMDGNLCKARRMAAIERARGIRASYYVRHTDRYYGWGWPNVTRRRSVLYRFRELQGLGHEVGLHFDVLAMEVAYGLDGATLLHTELSYLRSNGLDVIGGSAHGSPVSYRAGGFSNYEFFAGMTTRESITYRGRTTLLGQHALEEFGLDYEAYHIGYDHYFSEAGGHWGEKNPFEWLPKLQPGESAVILTHPVWWGKDDSPLEYL